MLGFLLAKVGSLITGDNSFRELKRNPLPHGSSREVIEKEQFAKLQRLVQHAYKHVPYYRELFDEHGLHPDSIQSFEDFSRIPPLTKEIIIQNKERLVSDVVLRGDLIDSATGGSTGDPLNFYRDKEYVEMGRVGMWRAFQQCGWRPGDNIAYIWGCSEDYYAKSELKKYLSAMLTRIWFYDTFNASEENFSHWIDRIKKTRPTVVFGYASAVESFADFILKSGEQISGVKGVFTTAETLFPSARGKIEQAFNSKVFNFYGSSEVLNIASECMSGSMHINTDYVYLENGDVVDDSGNRELIATSLLNYSMPFIRYKNGDMGQLSDACCECGLKTPLLELNVGRIGNVVTFPNGNRASGHFFEYFIYGTDGIKKFQVHQKTLDKFVLRIVKNDDFSDVTEKKLAEAESILKEKGGDVSLTIEYVDNIPLTKQGKHLYIISDVKKK